MKVFVVNLATFRESSYNIGVTLNFDKAVAIVEKFIYDQNEYRASWAKDVWYKDSDRRWSHKDSTLIIEEWDVND